MKAITTFWKFFRVICIVQLILVAFKGIYSFSRLFYGGNNLIYFIDMISHTMVFFFVYHGLSILNYNYPDIPLSTKQKRSFNILYLINFLLIAYLFAQVVSNWWMVPYLLNTNIIKNYWYIQAGQLIFPCFIFIIHLALLAGMFRLRRTIYQNTINSWYEQFDKKP